MFKAVYFVALLGMSKAGMAVVVKSSCTLETPREFIVSAYFACSCQCSSPTHRDSDLTGGWSSDMCVLKALQMMLLCR